MPYANKLDRKKYYELHKEEINKKRREYSKRPEVNKRKRLVEKLWRKKNKDKIHGFNVKFGKSYRQRLKDIVLEHYGNTCACCGESNTKFLSIDHINGGGEKHREQIGRKINGWLVKNNFPKGFQTLCFNCNWGKHINGGVCPHKDKICNS